MASAGVENPNRSNVDTAFLSSSHFQISQDRRVTNGSLKSVFKRDYVPWEVSSKPQAARPPRPAEVLHKDDQYFNEKASETRQQYDYRGLEGGPTQGLPQNIGATNFKMDRDPRFNSFQTTHNRDYTPKEAAGERGGSPKTKWKSFIPQGDPEKAPEPISDYRDRYRGHDANSFPMEKATGTSAGPSTIQGDRRQHNFHTTHNDTYRGVVLPKVKGFDAPVGSNIPVGDPDHGVSMVTTHQTSFPQHDPSQLRGYNKGAVTGKLRVTNHKEADGHGTWNTYLSTAKDSYRPIEGDIGRFFPGKHRNHSDFPTGDDSDWRNAERANMTTNRFYHGNKPQVGRPNIVGGAKKRTSSNVVFGEPSLGDNYYSTTTDSTFKPQSVKYDPVRPDRSGRSAVPLDYYGNDRNNTTYNTDFEDPEQDKMIPNPIAINKLKESHIVPPQGGMRLFSTEHLDQYTPKSSTLSAIDPGRLQRSSVPIGTLNVWIYTHEYI